MRHVMCCRVVQPLTSLLPWAAACAAGEQKLGSTDVLMFCTSCQHKHQKEASSKDVAQSSKTDKKSQFKYGNVITATWTTRAVAIIV